MEWLAGGLLFLLGFVVGCISYRFGFGGIKKQKQLRNKLDEIHAEYAQYQENVDQHFSKTSELMDQLAHSCIAVYQHMDQGAGKLSKRTIANRTIAASQDTFEPEAQPPIIALESSIKSGDFDSDELVASEGVEPPKDYAFKEDIIKASENAPSESDQIVETSVPISSKV